MQTHEPALGWTLVLRCQPLRIVDRRIVDRRPEGGYNDDYELACARSGSPCRQAATGAVKTVTVTAKLVSGRHLDAGANQEFTWRGIR